MSWYIAKTLDGECFPIFVDGDCIEIPHQNANSKFTINDWIITETYPNVVSNGSIEWKTREFAKLVTFQKMTCNIDYNRHVEKMATYTGKTVSVDDGQYHLSILKKNNVDGAFFASKSADGLYREIRFTDYKMFIGDGEKWIEKKEYKVD